MKENELQAKKNKKAKSMALQWQNETSQLWQARLQDLSAHTAVRLHEETPEHRQERLQNMLACQAVHLEEETAGNRTKYAHFYKGVYVHIMDTLLIFMLPLPYFANI